MIKALVFKDHVPPSSSPIWPLLGAGRFLNKTLCPRAKAAALHSSRGVTSITGTHLGQGMPFTRNTLITMQEVLHAGFPLFTTSTQAQRISTGQHSERSLAKSKLSEPRQSNLGNFNKYQNG